MKKIGNWIWFLLFLLVIFPTILPLLSSSFFSMHDSQHLVRLFLLDKGIKQGYLYPRWVDGLGFGYGYPLFNFYPPFIYYLAEVFHLIGFSLIWSIKLMLLTGFILAFWGVFFLIKTIRGSKTAAFFGASLYTYTLYHAITIYVRGAFAEFFAMSLLPFAFSGFFLLGKDLKMKNSIFLGIAVALLIITHPLIAFPAIFFFIVIAFFVFLKSTKKLLTGAYLILGGVFGLCLSAFFWLPSLIERKYTMVNMLTRELYNYKLHFIYPQQFWYSPWGFGGSIAGPFDGLSFQIGKIFIFLFIATTALSLLTLLRHKKDDNKSFFGLFFCLTIFAYFMACNWSQFIWDKINYLWYLQFPWRFLTFASLFLSASIAFFPDFLTKIFSTRERLINILVGLFLLLVISTYSKYFQPQSQIFTSDKEETTVEKIQWEVSRSSFEFVPKGVTTAKTDFGVTTLAIAKKDLPHTPLKIISGRVDWQTEQNKFQDKSFKVQVKSDASTLQLNTYAFPGWVAFLNGQPITIHNQNPLKLIRVEIPKGNYQLVYKYSGTLVQKLAGYLSLLMFLVLIFSGFLSRKQKVIKTVRVAKVK